MLPLLLSIFSLFFFRKSSRAFTINIKGAEQALVTLIFFFFFLLKMTSSPQPLEAKRRATPTFVFKNSAGFIVKLPNKIRKIACGIETKRHDEGLGVVVFSPFIYLFFFLQKKKNALHTLPVDLVKDITRR